MKYKPRVYWPELFAIVFTVLLFLAFVALDGQEGVKWSDGTRWNVSSQSIADNGGGTAATGTVTVLKSYVELTCLDVNGCTVTVSETGAREGMRLTVVVVVATGIATFADTSGVTETAGSFAADLYDCISYIYIGDRWVELARSNN